MGVPPKPTIRAAMIDPGVERRSDLPAEMTRFIGRRRELAEIERALDRSRLVTLCGVGGVGKSRLALRAAGAVRGRYADGARFIELSSLRKPDLLARSVADALDLPDRSAGDPVALLAERLAERHLLLVLDTCEHLVEACAMLAEVLLRAAPRLCILATSREPLDVMGEHILIVPPLDTPAPPEPGGAEDETECDSIRLFADRAEAMVPGFALDPENRQVVARLCRRLDGLPLAIELAAVRLRVMSVEQVDRRLGDRFRLLGTARSNRDRHQTLRATVEWSHELCTPAERLLWARLSVFPGSFGLEAAEHLQQSRARDARDTDLLDVLGRLVEKSIVLREDDGRRYRMLDTIREYGAERLGDLGEEHELRLRHREHYFALASDSMRDAVGERQIPLTRRLRGESANLRVALDHALSSPGDEPAALELAVELQSYWMALGLLGEARLWYGRALDACPDATPERGWACHAAAMFANLQGDQAAARPLLDEARELADRHGDADLHAHILQTAGRMALYAEDLAGAAELHERARAAYNEIGYRTPYALGNDMLLASVHAFGGEPDRALEVCEEGLKVSREHGDLWTQSFTLYVRAAAYWLRGDLDPARDDVLAALRTKEDFGDLFGITICLDLLGAIAVSSGDLVRGAVLLNSTQALWRTLGAPVQLGPFYLVILEGLREECRKGLAPDAYAGLSEHGQALSVDATVAIARGADPRPEGAADDDPGPLTPRENEVARLVARGLTNREIADALGIAKRTVDSHIEHIMTKLRVASRAQIAAWSSLRSRGA
ncbi:ATP-binding protein [Spirillospora sp. CA-294931]|uniref:ATP-binding protein n=1 Tax=Spirillospora sp. CA-294931 TaxID=3240042 RepID=UPI003D8E5C39